MTPIDRRRLMTKVARLYYDEDVRQPEIARRLYLSQTMVSRLLAAAHKEGIVRTTVLAPAGVFMELEQHLEERYGLNDAVVADCERDSGDEVIRAIASSAAAYLEATLGSQDVVGISSWSETLLRTVSAMQPQRHSGSNHVVQIMGGIGNASAEVHAIRMTQQLASLLKAEPHFLSAPNVTVTPEAAAAYLSEPQVQETLAYFGQLTVALVGVGAVSPSRLIGQSGNVFDETELRDLRRRGAVGEICIRFFDRAGAFVASPLNDRVIGIDVDEFRRVPRRVGIAGSAEKLDAIRGALEGRLINVLITDRITAERLVASSSKRSQGVSRRSAVVINHNGKDTTLRVAK